MYDYHVDTTVQWHVMYGGIVMWGVYVGGHPPNIANIMGHAGWCTHCKQLIITVPSAHTYIEGTRGPGQQSRLEAATWLHV